MSQNVEKISTVLIIDPRTDVGRKKYAIYRGPEKNQFTPTTTTNISTSSVTFNIKPQIKNFVTNKMRAQFPVRIRFDTNAPNGNPLLRANYDGPRSQPLQSGLASINVNMGGAGISAQVGEYIHAMEHIAMDEEMLGIELSGTPSYPDVSQSYNDMVGSVNNPLGSFGDGHALSILRRSAFPYTVIHNDQNYSVIDILITEDVFLSPWNVSKDMHPFFIGVQAIDITFQFYATNLAYRFWSHADGGAAAPGPITSSQIAFNDFGTIDAAPFSYETQAPQMLMQFLTPSLTEQIPLVNIYPYYNVQPFITQYGTTIAANTSSGYIQTNNIVFGRIPNRILIYARETNQTLFNSPTKTDSFFALEKLNVFFDNSSALFSSCTQYDLYSIARENGVKLSFTEWCQQPYRPGSLTNKMGCIGSILPLVFGKDIPVQPGMAPGVGGQFNFYIQASFKNLDPINAKSLAIYIVAITEGVINISNGVVNQQLDVINNMDVLNSQSADSPYVNYNMVKDVSGGNVWTGIRHFAHEVWENMREAARRAYNTYQKVKPYIDPLIDIGKTVLPLLAAGEGECGCPHCQGRGCAYCQLAQGYGEGGASMSKSQLRRRLRR